MLNSAITELQTLAEDSESDVLRLLLKAKVIATKLDMRDMTKWVDLEINGYAPDAEVPEYRELRLPLKAFNRARGQWIDVDLGTDDEEINKVFGTARFTESITSIKDNAKATDSKHLTLPASLAEFIYQNTTSRMKLAWMVNNPSLERILMSVRYKIHDWTLELQGEGFIGEEVQSGTNKEREVIPLTVNNITNINGNVHNAGVIGSGNGEITQSNIITLGNFEMLSRELKEIGVTNDEIAELRVAIDKSPKPESTDMLGEKIGGWMGKMVHKGFAGGLKIAATSVQTVITRALCLYYGLPL